MNAETGSEPEAPKKRGRIPQSAWPQILERYRSGATLSAIAREFECTPSAISYIIRKAEAAGEKDAPIEEGAVTDAVTDAAAEAPAGDAMAEEPPPAPVAVPEAPVPVKPTRRAAAPASAPSAQTAAPVAAPAAAPTAAPQPAPVPPAAPAQTETLRLNRPESQPAPQPAPVQPAAPAAQAPAQAASQAAVPSAAAADANRPAGTNPPPVDAVESRLRDTARGCLNAYRGWRQQPGEASIQTLSEAVHELRKALARIEIDMSASRREEQAIRPIPIPAHRTARRTP
ncbi:helix-turn-helix domain-containing protein [Azospirillum argentinense]